MTGSGRIIALLTTLVIILSVYYALNRGGKKRYNWHKIYNDELKQPYQFGVFKGMLKLRAENFEEIKELSIKTTISNSAFKKSCYVAIGHTTYLNSKDILALTDYLKSGNDVLIINESFAFKLLNELTSVGTVLETTSYIGDTVTAKINYSNRHCDSFRFVHHIGTSVSQTDWSVFSRFPGNSPNTDYIDPEENLRYLTLGTLDGMPDFIVIHVGKGRLYLHSNPQLFTNYALLDSSAFHYMNDVFKGMDLDNVFYDVGSRSFKNEDEDRRDGVSPLSYILAQKQLRTAWYVLLLTAVAFFLFKAKRRQNIIPVTGKKKNASLQFIRTLGELFFLKTVNKEMAKTAMNGLMFFIRHKLNVSTRNMDEARMNLIAMRSGNKAEDVTDLIMTGRRLTETTRKEISSKELMELERKINNFYKSYNNKE